MSADGEINEDPGEQWFVFVRGRQLGPLHFHQLKELNDKGRLSLDVLVRRNNGEWLRAKEVPELEGAPAVARSVETPESLRSGDAPAAADTPKRNYFARHWKGELSLPVSYWVNGIGFNLAAYVVILLLAAQMGFEENYRPGLALALVTILWATVPVAFLWQFVGTWRSASNYSRAHPRRYWGIIAQIIMVLGALRLAVEVVNSGIPQISEAANIFAGDRRMGAHAFKVLKDGEELEFSGGIAFGTAVEFERLVGTMPTLKVIHLNSHGGRVSEAAKIGALVKKRSFSTYAAKSCLSACTIIFLSGNERLITSATRLGFHQPDSPGLSAKDRSSIIRQEEARLRSLGVSAAFAHKANAAGHNDMWFPSTEELLTERVATRVVSANDYALSALPQNPQTDKLKEAFATRPIFKAIQKIDPVEYQKLQAAVESGQSLSESDTQLIFTRILPYTSDQRLMQYSGLLVRIARAYNTEDPSACYAYTKTAERSAKVLAMRAKFKALADEEDHLRLLILKGYTGEPRKIATEEEIQPLLDRVFGALEKQQVDFSLVRNEQVPPEKYSSYCEALASLLEQALALPSSREAASLLRFLLLPRSKG